MSAPLRTCFRTSVRIFSLDTAISFTFTQCHARCSVLLPRHQVTVPVLQMRRKFGQPASQTHPHLIKQGEVTPGITQPEYCQRRKDLVSAALTVLEVLKSEKDHIFIFPSASKTYMTYDIPYLFRQNSEFLYLCGFLEPDSMLILYAKEGTYRSALFVPRRDPNKEMWDGPQSGVEGAKPLTGVDEAYNIDELGEFFHKYCCDHSKYIAWYNESNIVHKDFHNRYVLDFLGTGHSRCIEDPTSLVQSQRLIKSEAEVNLMRKSAEVASQAFIEVMKFSHPGVNESHLYAKMDFECRIRDAEILAYPPVVAGGNRANIIHYINNNQLVQDGEMVLMDAGCEYHGYTSDITRTWPVSGKFSAPQRAVYLALLQVQEACIGMCTSKSSLGDIYNEMMSRLGFHLKDLGLIPKSLTNKSECFSRVQSFCPHHVSHYLGMDVHDTSMMPRNIKLKPGMIITVEPGIYISKDRTDVPEEFRGMGIRIEDDVLICDGRPEVLSASCPKHPDDIERIMAS